MLNNRAIEILSVDAVRDSLIATERLDPFINDNDKEPSWDGNVYIHKSNAKNKKQGIKKVSVQIKGKMCRDLPNNASFSASIIDLENYMRNNGCVFFLVYIRKKDLKRKIYYTVLTPIKILEILENCTNKKSKTIDFHELPNNHKEIINIFLNCYSNSQKQVGFMQSAIKDACNINNESLNGLVISSTSHKDSYSAFLDNDFSMYGIEEFSCGNIPVPIKTNNIIATMGFKKGHGIKIDEKYFDKKYMVMERAKIDEYDIEKGIVLIIDKELNVVKDIAFDFSKNRCIAINDLDFVILLLRGSVVSIDGHVAKNNTNTELLYKCEQLKRNIQSMP